MSEKPEYGFDAPSVIRWLLIFAFVSLGLAFFGYSYTQAEYPLLSKLLLAYFLLTSLSFFLAVVWMMFSSRTLKPKIIAQVVSQLHLKGDETALDVGCGRGIFSIQLAQALPRGKVHGMDLWLSKDQSGNHPNALMQNAQIAQVSDRIEVHTADMREIPFPDATFDLVVSNLAIHNLPSPEDRTRALHEIIRVLKPSGGFILIDFHHVPSYAATLRGELQVSELHLSPPIYRYCPPLTILTGKK